MPKKTMPELEYEASNCWDVYKTRKQRKAVADMAEDYRAFLTRCKTERETIDYALERAAAAGFSEDFSSTSCLRSNRGKTCFLARRGRKPLSAGFRLIGAHGDTPRLDLKQHPLYEDAGLALAKTHYYGGIRKHQWLARPLALHGVAVKTDGTTVPITVGEDPADPVMTISDLLPHLAHKLMNKKVSDAFEAEKLNVVFGHCPVKPGKDAPKERAKRLLLEHLWEQYGLVEADLYSAEMQMVPAGQARFVGLDRALIGGYGQDDRASCFAALEALFAEPEPEHCQVVLLWDKEEIGSDGATGAKSLFFEYCMQELVEAWEPEARLSQVFMDGKAISADVTAAVEPDYQDLYEKRNSAWIGYGPCFNKFTGHRGKYGANDAHPEFIAFLRRILDGAGVPWQMAELGRVDLGGGGTVAKFLAVYGMDIIDMGTPVLSMHSPFELTSAADVYATVQAFREFLRS